jgi:circadian clock protein KaiC
LSDDVIFQRYVEIEGRMRKVMTVVKMRGSQHSKDLRLYDVTESGLLLGNTLYDYRGIITGVARRHMADESEAKD